MRIALLTPTFGPGDERSDPVAALGSMLVRRGHAVRVIAGHRARTQRTTEGDIEVARVWAPPGGRLERRRYEPGLTHLPLALRELRRGEPDLVHAFSPGDGAIAARWSRETGRPAVLTLFDTPDHATLVARRLRLRAVLSAIDGTAAVVVSSPQAAAAAQRWLGIDACVIAPGPDQADAHENLYRHVVAEC